MFDAKKVKNEIVEWIRNWFEQNGKDCMAVVGISGGKDSSVVAALCVEALGKDRVFGVMMPQGRQRDIEYSRKLCSFLDIPRTIIPVGTIVNVAEYEIKTSLDEELSIQTTTNLPARIRMATLYAVSQTVNGRVANTCNLSEDWVGYATRYGDAAGDFSPLSQLTVTEVKAIGRELGLPSELVDKTPTDGLCGKTDEDNLGFTYAELDAYIRDVKEVFTVFDHPLLMAEAVRKHKEDAVISDKEIELIANAIESHMGQWTTSNKPKDAGIVLPKPSNKYHEIVHLADYLASRKPLDMEFDEWKKPELPPLDTYVLNFGKYKNERLVEIAQKDKGYIDWLKENYGREPVRSLLKQL